MRVYTLERGGMAITVKASPEACYDWFRSVYSIEKIDELGESEKYMKAPSGRTGRVWHFDAEVVQRVFEVETQNLRIWEWEFSDAPTQV